MARPAKSEAEKRITGAGKRKLAGKSVTRRPASKVPAPRWLSSKARTIWYRVVPDLVQFNLMTAGDADVIGRYCTDLAQWIKASSTLDKEGLTVLVPMTNSEHSMPRRHPAIQVCSDLHRRMIDIEDRFGKSALARVRIYAQQQAYPGAFGDLFGNRDGSDGLTPGAEPPSAASPIGVLRPGQLN